MKPISSRSGQIIVGICALAFFVRVGQSVFDPPPKPADPLLAQAASEKPPPMDTTAADRVAATKKLTDLYLEDWQDVNVEAVGKGSTKLVLTSITVSKPLIYHVLESGALLEGLRARGFRCLELRDGYSILWSYDLRTAEQNKC